ncbi:MAG: hypothetical protein JWN98_640 [Abditibacteriota bacterium]|nr:hypothetical protein [Abditibacteriota bacterium]
MYHTPSRYIQSLHFNFLRVALTTALFTAPVCAADTPSSQWLTSTKALIPISLSDLNRRAPQAVQAKSNVPLVADDALLRQAASLGVEPARTPNYLRALATMPKAMGPFAHLIKTAIFSGDLSPETKLAMGLRVAQLHQSTYAGAHFQRMLRGCPDGARWLTSLNQNKESTLPNADRLALRYAEQLTRNIHGVDEAEFARVRAHFNDSQIVELTLTTCLWNYFTRLCAGWNLPLEAWALPEGAQSTFTPPAGAYQRPFARVGLISDAELAAFTEVPTPAAPQTPQLTETVQATTSSATTTIPAATQNGLGIRVANSKRAMMRTPLFGTAWFDYWKAVREDSKIGREMLLQVSFAVSMANGCRYCTLHQVQGLRRLNVDAAKLVAMKKDDAALTSRERVAVTFARQLTRDPASVTKADFATIEREFGVGGANEVLLQTCAFNFMNRFTDGLNLPSEDEAIQTYHEVYGLDWK